MKKSDRLLAINHMKVERVKTNNICLNTELGLLSDGNIYHIMHPILYQINSLTHISI